MARREDESVRSMLTKLEGGWEGEGPDPAGAPAPPHAGGGGPVARATVRMVRPEVPRPVSTRPPPPVEATPSAQARTLPLDAPRPELPAEPAQPVTVGRVITINPPAASPAPPSPPAPAPPEAPPAQVVAQAVPVQPSGTSSDGSPSTSRMVAAPKVTDQPAPAVQTPAPTAGSALVLVSREQPSTPPAGPIPSFRPQLPPGSGPLDPRLVLVVEPESARSVAFRLLRDTLLSKGLPRILAVAGTAPQDGVTTCAVNFALALAEQGEKRVLLVDGNFGSPALARIFMMDGFTPPSTAADALLPLKLAALMPRFHVAAIVRRNGEPAPRFDKIRFQRVLEHLGKQGYDHIVLDAGPLRAGSAAGQLVTTAEATLLAVRAGRTTARALRRATSQIPPGRAIGVTLVDADEPHE